MKQQTIIAPLLVLIILASCFGGLMSDAPTNTERDRAYAALALMKPGEPESLISVHFASAATAKLKTYAIVDMDTFVAEGHTARTYWIGYQYVKSSSSYTTGAVSAGVETQRIAAIRTVNGIIESVYYP